MPLPPKGAEPTALWMRFAERPRPTTLVDLPRNGDDGQTLGQVKMWVLTESELYTCRANAEATAKKILGDNAPKGAETNFGYEDIYRNELYVELLALACRDAENTLFPFVANAMYLRQKATTDEIAVLMRAYDAWRRECGPVVSELTEPELEAWLKVLMEGASRVPLSMFSGEAQSDLIMFLVSRLKQGSSTATGSAGSPQDEASTEVVRPINELVDESEKPHTEP